ncbi:BsaA family SipW-dependent biofilm matrix protein [Sarcina ventriculi]|uniref:BsaA family SipW-dependent biofilm matrix protein n=1 Tax=Sarcina ventriculi TaxID=1267 RepID=UPI00073E97DB|nr:BsaA family SipW-dependent biofilm matrix protein [Sarcina ventriculi]
MNKKKVSALLIAGILSIGAIGGTLAWFTSQDSVTNAFQTGSTDNPGDTNSGIDIKEEFNENDAGNMTPGDEVNKKVSVTNTASYNQLIRVKIEKVWKDSKGNVVTHYIESKGNAEDKQGNDVTTQTVQYLSSKEASITNEAQLLNKDLIILNLDISGWINNNDAELGNDGGYYYYNSVVNPNQSTSQLLKSVTLSSEASNVYKNLKFDVIVTAESVQASNGAVETWKNIPEEIKNLGK